MNEKQKDKLLKYTEGKTTYFYDNRAEEVTYDENGKVATFKAFEYGREDYNGKGNTDDNPNLQGKDKKQ